MQQTLHGEDSKRFEVTLEVFGKSYILTRSAPTYIDLVHDINRTFGNVLILSVRDLD